MPRANRHIQPGCTYHVTHRCHDQAFLLKFARDRQAYRACLRDGLQRYDVKVLTYCITSNHVHLLLRAGATEEVSALMQFVEGGFAQAYNQRKRRTGAFWSDRYHATMIEDGIHAWRCMRYIDLNMVRAGVVRHPREWDWTGWGELMGERRRNRVVNLQAVVSAFETGDIDRFRRQYEAYLGETLASGPLVREPWWSQSVAVGSPDFVARIEASLRSDFTRKKLESFSEEDGTMILRECPIEAYGAISKPENRAIRPLDAAQFNLIDSR